MAKVKRTNGKTEDFNKDSIYNDLVQASGTAQELKSKALLDRIFNKILTDIKAVKGTEVITTDEIQNIVEATLLKSAYKNTAKEYILNRDHKKRAKEIASAFNTDLITKYVKKTDWKVNENSNMGYSLQGLNNYIASEVCKTYWLNKVYNNEIKTAHTNGDLHIHDLNSLSTYCVGWDLYDLLMNGFTGVPDKVESAPAKHFRTALGQIVNFFYTLQGESAGAQAFSNVDTLLAPFIAYDKLSDEEVKQALQEFIFNCNVPTRVGFQTPFTNITLDLTVPSYYKTQGVVIGGKVQKRTYSEFQKEMDLFNNALMAIMAEGDVKGRVFTFPIPTYNITKDFDWDNPNLDNLWKMTGKYGVPYFANFINSSMNPEDARSMCPLHESTELLIKSNRGICVSPIKDVAINSYKDRDYYVFYNGVWSKAKPILTGKQDIYEVTLINGDVIKFGAHHLQPTKDNGTIEASQLTENDYLPYNTSAYDCSSGDYDLGYIIGLYIGDGSSGDGGITYSLNKNTDVEAAKKTKEFFEKLGFSTRTTIEEEVLSLTIKGSAASTLIDRYVTGTALNKKFTNYIYNLSSKARQGVLDGWEQSDGGNSGRIYSFSKEAFEQFKSLCTSLGLVFKLDYIDTRDDRFSANPCYVFKYLKRENLSNRVVTENETTYVKIEKIVKLQKQEPTYCISVDNDSQLFTLGSGLITHNCRLRIDNRELASKGGGLFGAAPLTGSIGVVTINLPRLGVVSKTEKEFFDSLNKLLITAKESLEIKRSIIEQLTEENLYPYTKFYLRNIKERYDSYWKNHFSTIGIIGMQECCLNFLDVPITDAKGKEFAEDVMNYIREVLLKFQEETGNNYNLEATPAEGLSYRFALMDSKQFPNMKMSCDSGNPYYTNSTHIPVNHTDDIFEVLDHQNSLQAKYTGGTVIHIFIGEKLEDISIVKNFVKTICEKYEIPYFTLTPTFSVCKTHGYLSGEHTECPKCSGITEVYSRIVGYLRPVSQWNKGKKSEFIDRKTYEVK